MDFTKYLVENAYVLIPVLYILGNILKDLKSIPDKFIPLLLLGLGILLSCAWLGFNVSSVIQGILITGITVYSNQVVKQLLKDSSLENLTVQAINATNNAKEEVKTESTTTAINNTITENSQDISINDEGIVVANGSATVEDNSINANNQNNSLNASSKISVDIPNE